VADEEPKIREQVRAYRDHPALLAWYLNDELDASAADQARFSEISRLSY